MTSLLPIMPVVLWSDALVYLLVAVILVFAWHVRRHEHLLAPWRKVAQSRSGMVAAVVLAVFAAVSPALGGWRRWRQGQLRCRDAVAVRRGGGTPAHQAGKDLLRAAGDPFVRQGDGGTAGWQAGAAFSPADIRRRPSRRSGNRLGMGRGETRDCRRGNRDIGLESAGADRHHLVIAARQPRSEERRVGK